MSVSLHWGFLHANNSLSKKNVPKTAETPNNSFPWINIQFDPLICFVLVDFVVYNAWFSNVFFTFYFGHFQLQLGLKMTKHEELEEPSITKSIPGGGKANSSNGDHHNGGTNGAYKNGSTVEDDWERYHFIQIQCHTFFLCWRKEEVEEWTCVILTRLAQGICALFAPSSLCW